MEILSSDMLNRLTKQEEVVVWATTVTTVGDNWASSLGSPHLSIILKPTFGKIDGDNWNLKFYPVKSNNNGFVKTGRNQTGVTCFSTYEEAATHFNSEIQKFVKIKEKEISEANEFLVSPSL